MAHKLAPSLKPPHEPTLHELVWDTALDDWVAGRLVRCSKCGEPTPASLASVATCSVCTYVAGRCETCGGQPGAVRSVIAHCRGMSFKNMVRRYGSDHADAITRVMKAKAVTMKQLRLLRGGKK